MGKKKTRVRQHPVVANFAVALRARRRALGYSQAELAARSAVAATYVTKLESGASAPQVDTVARLAAALGVGIADLLPDDAPADPTSALREQARRLAAEVIAAADRETLQLLCPLLARLGEAPASNR
jgi:transcriptional regulator with XRE-family HTH domain